MSNLIAYASGDLQLSKQLLLDHSIVEFHGKFHGNQILRAFGRFSFLASEKEEILSVSCWWAHIQVVWSVEENCHTQPKKSNV